MSKKKGSDKLRNSADKTRVRSSANVGSVQNQKWNPTTKKGPPGPE